MSLSPRESWWTYERGGLAGSRHCGGFLCGRVGGIWGARFAVLMEDLAMTCQHGATVVQLVDKSGAGKRHCLVCGAAQNIGPWIPSATGTPEMIGNAAAAFGGYRGTCEPEVSQ